MSKWPRRCLRKCRECGYEAVTSATTHMVRRPNSRNYPHWDRRILCGTMRVVHEEGRIVNKSKLRISEEE